MQNSLRDPVVLLGRIFIGLIFLLSGIGKIGGFDGTVGYIGSRGLPMPQIVAALTILIEVGGGLALMLGVWTRWAALALAVFTLLAGLLFHNFWAVPEAQVAMQRINFLKNLSMAGGMLVLYAFGPGALSIDARRRAA